ncbi:hypothetical protein QPK87_34900 [Kamptonema cortianum]|nr:hypothetical protein [Kamptonema cortianum]
MTLFDHQRLTQATLQLHVEGIRSGLYSDKYFENVVHVLEGVRAAGYRFEGRSWRADEQGADLSNVNVGDLIVEAQVFNRRAPYALVAGVDAALVMLRWASGCFEGGQFVETWADLEVEAVEDGALTHYDGDPEEVQPVLRIRGRYRDFALLETTILGVLSRATRIATSSYEAIKAAAGKPVLFFPARFDLPETQAVDGYAYWLAVQRYNAETGAERSTQAFVSTDAQAAWWGGRGGGTIPHSLIAAFMGDTAEAMAAFARHASPDIPRIVLADFDNDVISTSLETLRLYFGHYRRSVEQGDHEEQRRWTLYAVRLDTSANLRDRAMEPDGPLGVSPELVRRLRKALDTAWQNWDLPDEQTELARTYCENVKIAVTGGFNRDRILEFEAAEAPVDIYGVGSSLLRNDSSTNTDYTMDIVRVLVNGRWIDMAKVGRRANENSDLKPVDLGSL